MGPELLFAFRHPRMLVFLDSASGGSLIQHPCVTKEKAEPNNPKVSMAKEGEKDMKVEEDAAKSKYPFSEIYDYIVHKTYPSHSDKLYKHGLRKRSKFFTAEDVYTTLAEKGVKYLAWWLKVRRRGGG